MTYATLLDQANETARRALAMYTNGDTIVDIPHEQVRAMDDELQALSNELCTSNIPESDLALSSHINDLDWIQSTIDHMNAAIFTTALWTTTDYAATTAFFRTVIPKQLHHRDDIINVYLEFVEQWAVVDTLRHSINQHTTREIIDKMKRRIECDLEYEDQLQLQRVRDAFMKKYEHPMCDLKALFDPKRVQRSWVHVLPIVLEAIDKKVKDLQHAKDHKGDDPIFSDDDSFDVDTTTNGDDESLKEELDELIDEYDDEMEDAIIEYDHGEEKDEESQHAATQRRPTNEDLERIDLQACCELQVYHDVIYDDDDITGWDIQGSDSTSLFPMRDEDIPSPYDYSPPGRPHTDLSRINEEGLSFSDNLSMSISQMDYTNSPMMENHDTANDPRSSSRYRDWSSDEAHDPLSTTLPSTTNYTLSTNVACHTRQLAGRGDIARGGTTRGHHPQQLTSSTSNAQQQEQKINNPRSTNVTVVPGIQRHRRRHRRNTPPIPPPLEDVSGLRKLNEYWTDEEISALDAGLRMYSRRWITIKAEFPDILRNRTNAQLREKARNIARQRRKEGSPLEHYEGCG